MSSLISALNWYHKKIGAYDKNYGKNQLTKNLKELKSDNELQNKVTNLKDERQSDLRLLSGDSRWKLQTNALVSCILVILYFLQIIAIFLYFSADEKEFPDVPVSEILTPAAMTFILGIVHSQIVATFSSTKTQKNVTREKRRKLKCKRAKKPANYDRESKSSPDSASDDRHEILDVSHLRKTSNDNCDKKVTPSVNESCTQCHPCGCKKLYKNGQHLRFSFEDNSKANFSNEESNVDSNFIQPPENCINVDFKNSKTDVLKSSSLSTEINSEQRQVQDLELNHYNTKTDKSHISSSLKNNFSIKNSSEYSKSDIIDISLIQPQKSSNIQVGNDTLFFKESCNHSSVDRDNENFSSDEDFFIARKLSGSREQWTNYSVEMKNSCHVSKLCTKSHQSLNSVASRRYSDGGLSYKQRNYHAMCLSLQHHRHSVDNILIDNHVLSDGEESAAVSLKDNPKMSESGIPSLGLRNRKNGCQGNIPCALKLPINIKNFSSSCDSCTETSPNTPSKPHTSDLEWPLITNTDCNSDSTDCSTQCSEGNASDISPSENPFAWEIQEPSKKPSNVGHSGSDKGYRPRAVSCTIWEHNECKKADLTALDISSAIIQKVDSSQHSSEYLYIGVFFAIVLSLLPLLFRLRNGVSTYNIQDVSTDALTLTVPSSEEVVKITDGLLDVMLGSGWRVKFVTLIMLVERFTLSLAYFFLLSVAEKTFKQRFLYAKHFCYLTSSRRAKRSDLPHFRLNKVRNIKIWLSIRSYMKKLGPQRSVDVIVSIAFILEVCVVSFLCIQLLRETGQFADKLHCWELLFWTLSLGTFLLRFMVIGTKINKKYRNLSVLITEQINLYLHMEQKPHKKEELILANNVLKLAADLLKELESPFKISGLCANSYLYNVTKVIVLSAFSAVLTDVLGFKLKLYKIKIK
ncbi:putative homeodomain transcription factor [Trichonephila clavata]|uniref:Putative homeodomain transcription factor n=1 Tax=Trichonephila clavata TaxID=2740835 RepID=A0A8X6GNB6_TRICU|nr:putative homeodomain transcription factor [Trichonephila clavata]